MPTCRVENRPPIWKEPDRLAALRGFDVLDTEPETEFNDLVRIAARICDAPIAAVNFIDERRQWFKSEIGLSVRETALDISICAHAILQPDLFVIPDLSQDQRFCGNALVAGEPHLRFYACALLSTDDGLPLGTLCVLDHKPRPAGLTKEQEDTLLALARAVMSQLKLRKLNRALAGSEQKLRATIDTIPQMVWSARPDGCNDLYNRRWYEFTGAAHGSADGERWSRIIHPDDLDRVLARWRSSLESGQEYEAEYRLHHRSGEYRWVLSRALPVHSPHGDIERWFGTCTDIHNAKVAEAALVESERRHRALIEASAAMVWRAAPDGSILTGWGWEDYCGQSPEQYEGHGWLEVVHPDDRDGLVSVWHDILASGEPGAAEYRVRCSSGEYRWIHARAVPLKADDGTIQEWVGTIADVHEQRLGAERAHQSRERSRALLEASAIVLWFASPSGRITSSRGWMGFTGQAESESIGVGWLDAVHPDDRADTLAAWQRALSNKSFYTTEFRVRRSSGEYRWVSASAVPRLNADGSICEWVGSISDIHDRKQAEAQLRASEERLLLALQAGRMAALEMDLETKVITRHQNTLDLLGIESSTLPDFMRHVHPEDQRKQEQFFQEIQTTGASSLEFRYTPPYGETRWFGLRAERCAPHHVIGLISDISDRKSAECQLWRLANHDPLTGLPNRAFFQRRLEEALTEARKKSTTVSLLLIDLDAFKDINDSFGHDAGDALLKATAERLTAAVRDDDTVARFGGDEFAILLTDSSKLEHASTLAEGIVRKLSHPLSYAGQMIATRVSIGVAAFPNHHAEPAELMKDADIALYRAKSEGRNRVVTYAPELRTATEQRLTLRREMRGAISGDQIRPFYQPKVNLSTGEIVGFEALARWQHPQHGLLNAASFGNVFDDPELAATVGKRLIGKIASDMRRWVSKGLPFGRVAINLSHVEFMHPGLAEDVLRVLDLAKVPTTHFEIEITERVLLDAHSELVVAALDKFRSRGVQIALDDFGTGYASLVHLKQFPVDHIKIDQSFVRDLEEDLDDEAIVGAVISLGRSLNLQVTAEGVETLGQAQRLREMGCGSGQGYLYATPMAGSDVPEFLAGWCARRIPPKRLLVVEG